MMRTILQSAIRPRTIILIVALRLLLVDITWAGDIAVVVNPDVPLNNLSLEEVRSLLLAERQFWSPDLKVTILIRAPLSRLRDVMIKTICDMTEAQFRQYWISKIFRDEATEGPK